MKLTAEEIRVLGCLMEKAATTPDQYPLSTNALITACNQKSSREPVVAYDERTVAETMLLLRPAGLARTVKAGRTDKHRHVLDEALELNVEQLAVLAVAMLRGPQSTGELRTRTERYVGFETVEQVEAVLQQLSAREEPLMRNLGRGSGQSQDRWGHLLGGTDHGREIKADSRLQPADRMRAQATPIEDSPTESPVFRQVDQVEDTISSNLTANDVEAFHRSLSNWGRWGGADQLGALNLITEAKRVTAARLVRSGKTVSLARPIDTSPAPDNPQPAAHHMLGTHTEGHGADYLAIAPHGYATSHLDALCHIFHEDQLYNGYSTRTVTAHGSEKLGVHQLRSGVVTRGVLLDIPLIRGVDSLEPGTAIGPDELEAAEAAAGVTVEPGDLLVVRTGRWGWRQKHGPWVARERLAGLHASCLPWLRERDVAILGSDGVSDVHPSGIEGSRLPIHQVAIVAMGLHLLDNLDLDDLAATCLDESRWEFLLTVAPLVLVGGTASPVNPIALF